MSSHVETVLTCDGPDLGRACTTKVVGSGGVTPAAEFVTQTILASDPKRLGNCVSACAATHLGLPLEAVPHFVEADANATVDGSEGSTGWWWLLTGFMSGHSGLWPTILDSIDDGEPGEVLWVAGPSSRGVFHQVLYRDGVLWHDPHPSRDGVVEIHEVIAWRPARHDHTPTKQGPARVGTS